jgi:hypothetical protein
MYNIIYISEKSYLGRKMYFIFDIKSALAVIEVRALRHTDERINTKILCRMYNSPVRK